MLPFLLKWKDKFSFLRQWKRKSEIWQKKKNASKMSSFACDFYCYSEVDARTAAMACRRNNDIWDILDPHSTLTRKEVRAMYRMEFLTASQWAVVMEGSGIQVECDASVADLVKKITDWRRQRGDFDMQANEEEQEQEQEHELEGDEVPRLDETMEGVNEFMLEFGFLKTDLQAECLLRGIPYEGHDSKAQLISKLIRHRQSPSLNSFAVLAEQSR